ncbi:Bacteriophage Lambda NinG protein [compost metagenome]
MGIYDKKSVSQLIQIAQKYVNAYIRQRDDKGGYFICISCGQYKRTDLNNYNAGHYLSAGNHSFTRFNENNIHGQCVKCNNYLSANLINYRKNLIKKIGQSAVDELEAMAHKSHKWFPHELIEIIETYKLKLKQAA